MTHPTQIFLANPQALRVEYRLDDWRLDVWWSPRAGRSTACADRNYDLYFNLIQHSTYAMLAALRGDAAYLAKAGRVWPELAKLLARRTAGIPVYAEQLLADGGRVLVPHWGQASSCCVWGLAMPNFAPLADWDAVLAAAMDAIADRPDMHWINGICAAAAAVDPWTYPEERLLALHRRVAAETNRPGRFLPMGGAMPEKFNAPPGNLYHDIWVCSCLQSPQ